MRGEIRLLPQHNFEQALRDVAGFSHLWLIYVFHQNTAGWKPLTRPPRGIRKVGVFACRSPYRPNPIGLSCVELESIAGLVLWVRGADLLDGTPVLDIKPYLPDADAVPDARCGWVAEAEAESPAWTVEFAESARRQIAWLEANGVPAVGSFLSQQLAVEPLDGTRKRLRHEQTDTWTIAYRTWRVRFRADPVNRRITVLDLHSGYTPAALALPADRYGDKDVHRRFCARKGLPGRNDAQGLQP